MFSFVKDKILSFLFPDNRKPIKAKRSKRTKCQHLKDASKESFDDEITATSVLDPDDFGEQQKTTHQPDSQRLRGVSCLHKECPKPTRNDVLIGPEHGELISCEGTEKLYRSVFAANMKYHACKNYKEKVAVISDIMDSIKMQKPVGRFLKFDVSTQCWIEVSDEYACLHVLKLLVTGKDTAHNLDRALKDAALLGSISNTCPQYYATSDRKALLSTARASRLVTSAVIEAAIRTSEKEEAMINFAAYANGEETKIDRDGHPNYIEPLATDSNRYHDRYLNSGNCVIQDSEEEQALVSIALFNYETFHGMEHGTATLEFVAATSAGIHGWAACALPVSEQNDDPGDRGEPNLLHHHSHAKPSATLPPGDDEEACQLQKALLESQGVRPSRKSDMVENSYALEETISSYYYEDDDASSGTRSDASYSTEDAGIAAANEKEDTKVCAAYFWRKNIITSKWQFEELMKQVKQRGEAALGSKDSEINSHPVSSSASQQDKYGVANEASIVNKAATKRQTDTSSGSSNDTDSWLDVSVGEDTKFVPAQECGLEVDNDVTTSGDWEAVGALEKDGKSSTGELANEFCVWKG